MTLNATTPISITAEQAMQLQALQLAHDYGNAYRLLRDIAQEANGDAGLMGWFDAAAHINENDGGFWSEFVRGATSAAGTLNGHAVSDEDFQTASDALANSVIDRVLVDNAIPSVTTILEEDVSQVVTSLGLPPYAWAGTLGSPFVLSYEYNTWANNFTGADGREMGIQFGQVLVANYMGLSRVLHLDNSTDALRDLFRRGEALAGGLLGDLVKASGKLSPFFSDWLSFFNSAEDASAPPCPLVLDLNGDGALSLALSDGVYFDNDGNGFSEATGWVEPSDGLLVLDRNADGSVNSGAELFGTETLLQNGQLAQNGFAALAEWDSNVDGNFDQQDAIWSDLRVWIDSNSDGLSSPEELMRLSDADIRSIALGYTNGAGVDASGNDAWLTGSFTRTDESSGVITDFRFARDTTLAIPEEWFVVPTSIANLPDVQGSGSLYDLHQAMVRDTSGTLQTLVEDFAAENDSVARDVLLEQIILKWTGAENVDSESRGANFDAKHLTALEVFAGRAFVGAGGSSNPNINAAPFLNSAYEDLGEAVYGQLMAQTHLEYLYSQIGYGWDENSQTIVGDLGAIKSYFEVSIPQGDGLPLLDAAEFVRTVKGIGAAGVLGLDTLQSVPGMALLLNTSFAILSGGAGNDTITGSDQSDVIAGMAGDDTIASGAGNDVVSGGEGDDAITDTGGNDVVYGGDGSDTITVSSYYWGSNTLYGGAGDDTITVPFTQWAYNQVNETQTLSGGLGNDIFNVGIGNDVFLYDRGDGADTITDYSSTYPDTDRVVFGAGIADTDVGAHHVTQYDLQLVIADPNNPSANDSITIKNWYLGSAYQIEQLQFNGGAVLTAAQVNAMAATIVGTEGNDTIQGFDTSDVIYGYGGDDTINSGNGSDIVYGGDGNDTITDVGGNDLVYGGDGNDSITVSSYYWGSNTVYGGAGNDTITVPNTQWPNNEASQTQTLSGGLGNDIFNVGIGTDVFLYDRGDGADTITDNSSTYPDTDRIVFGAGIADTDISVHHVTQYDLQIVITDTNNPLANDSITIKNWYLGSAYQVERLEFDGGEVLTAAQLSAMAIVSGSEGDDTIQSFSSNDLIYGYGGNDTITDPGGNDLVYGGDGNDAITVSSYYWGSNTVYAGAGDDTITVPTTQWYSNQANQTQTLSGGAGNDTFNGGIGTTVYLFDRGDGVDTITDYSSNFAATDRIVFGAGIADTDISARHVTQYDLQIVIADPNNPSAYDRITIKNWYQSAAYQIEQLQFDGGAVLTAAQLNAMAVIAGTESNDTIQGFDTNDVIYGYGGDDTITDPGGNDVVYGGDGNDTITVEANNSRYGNCTVYGGAGDDAITVYANNYSMVNYYHQTLSGGTGNDIINGSVGSDTYLFNRGDGADTITDIFGASDKILFGVGISVGDITAARSGASDLEIRVADPGNAQADDRMIVKNWYASANNRVEQLQFADGTIVSTATGLNVGDGNANSISGSATSDILAGGAGDDTLSGSGGADSLSGDAGNDTLNGGAGDDTLRAGDGNDVLNGEDGNDVLYGEAGSDTLNGGADDDYLAGGADGDVVSGGDGNDIAQGGQGDDQLLGNDGNDLLTGDAGNDTLDGGAGNDLLAGGTGDDTISTGGGDNVVLFNAGGGTDTVYSAAGAQNTLSFGGGITYDDLSLSKAGNDLVVNVGQNDKMILKDWYAGSNNVLNLQIILDATSQFDANSSDPLYNRKVETFDFLGMVNEFDQALAQSPGLTSWAMTNALLQFHLSGSDDYALGGDLAYWYGKNGGFTGMSVTAAQQVLGDAGFGSDAQALHPFDGLQEGYVKLS